MSLDVEHLKSIVLCMGGRIEDGPVFQAGMRSICAEAMRFALEVEAQARAEAFQATVERERKLIAELRGELQGLAGKGPG